MEWKPASLVRESMGRDGKKLRGGMPGKVQDRIPRRVARGSKLRGVHAPLGSVRDQGRSALADGAAKLTILTLLGIIFFAMAAAVLVIVRVLFDLVLGIFVIGGLIVVGRLLWTTLLTIRKDQA